LVVQVKKAMEILSVGAIEAAVFSLDMRYAKYKKK
jgi:hypothetical protein